MQTRSCHSLLGVLGSHFSSLFPVLSTLSGSTLFPDRILWQRSYIAAGLSVCRDGMDATIVVAEFVACRIVIEAVMS